METPVTHACAPAREAMARYLLRAHARNGGNAKRFTMLHRSLRYRSEILIRHAIPVLLLRDGLSYNGPMKTKLRDLHIWLKPEDHDRLAALAASEVRSTAQMARMLVLRGIRDFEPSKRKDDTG